MKKKLLMLTLVGALGCTALTACGKENEPSSPEKKQEKEKDGEEENGKEEKEEEPAAPEEDEPVEVDAEDYDAVFEPLLGEWAYAGDDMDPTYLTVYTEGGLYYYELADMSLLGSSKGTVDLYSEEHPDGSISLWYRFVDENGEEWASFAVNEDDPFPDDIYSGQDGAMHFVRSSHGDEQMGDVQGYFFVGTWQCDGYVMEILDNGNNSYFVTIESPEINKEIREWEYECVFDEEYEFLFSDTGELIVLEMENGEVSSKHSEYADGSVNFYFDNGGIVWADHVDTSHQDMVFEYVSD